MAKHSIKILRILPLLLTIYISSASDPSPLQDLCVANPSKPSGLAINGVPCKDPAKTVARDFKSSLLAKAGNTSNSLGSALTIATASSFPGLNTQGLSFARIDYSKGGIVQPHFHPRASEVLYVMKGTLVAGFMDTQNRLFEETVKEGELFVFPQGMVHFIQNLGDGPAVSLSSLNSQNPGAVLLAKTLFASKPTVPDTVLAKAFKISLHEVHSIQIGLSRP
ncbi:germin-like protein subfamily 2 member 1 [Cryptomeria japonica]|uniref:germin-like protein subfamily 2 member 1 n=1 Tax=Cryptomeria japonica TaxID=3369 RepID=UPI0027DA349D|nr:germin-like protein subfamily 2 member 1 [Cryptomeria japonica]